jgi:hypothetical protein
MDKLPEDLRPELPTDLIPNCPLCNTPWGIHSESVTSDGLLSRRYKCCCGQKITHITNHQAEK